HVDEILEGALDLGLGGMWETGVERGDGDGVGDFGEKSEQVLAEEAMMERVGAVLEEVSSGERVGTHNGDARNGGMFRQGMDLKRESGGEGSADTTFGVGQKPLTGDFRVGREEQVARGEGGEMAGALKHGRTGRTTFGRTGADK